MDLTIIEKWSKNNLAYKQAKPLVPTGILVHGTGTNQKKVSAYLNQEAFAGPNSTACVHSWIGNDDNGQLVIIRALPYDYRSWGCGSGSKGSYNSSHIQFEICEDWKDDVWYLKAYNLAIAYAAQLCFEFNFDPATITSHTEAHKLGYASNHADPLATNEFPRIKKSMDTFREDVAVALKRIKEDSEMTYDKFKKLMDTYLADLADDAASDWTQDELSQAQNLKITDATRPKAFVTREEAAILALRAAKLSQVIKLN